MASSDFCIENNEAQVNVRVAHLQKELRAAEHNYDLILKNFLKSCQAYTRASGALFELVDQNETVCRAASGTAANLIGLKTKLINSLSETSLNQNRSLICREEASSPDANNSLSAKKPMRSIFIAPLKREGKPVGVLKLFSDRVGAFSAEEQTQLEIFCKILEGALEQATLHNKLVRRYEERLKESSSLLAQVFQGMPTPLCVIDRMGKVRYWGAASVGYFGWSDAEVMGATPPFVSKELEFQWSQALKQAEVLDTAYAFELAALNKEGFPIHMSLTIVALKDSTKKPYGFMLVGSDVAEKIRYKKELELAQTIVNHTTRIKSESIAQVAAGVRKPIHELVESLDQLNQTSLSTEQNDVVESLQESTHLLLKNVNAALSPKPKCLEKEKPIPKFFSLREVFDLLEENLKETHADAPPKFIRAVAENVPQTYCGDSSGFKSALDALLQLGIKNNTSGILGLEVYLEQRQGRECVLRLELSGIDFVPSESDLSKLDHFVKEIAGDKGSTISESNDLCVWMSFKLKEYEKIVEPINTPILKTLNVFIVESRPLLRLSTIRSLEKLGHKVKVFQKGQLIIDQLATEACDLIIMDCHSIEAGGLGATQFIRASKVLPNPAIPIVALSAQFKIDERKKLLDAGVSEILYKPQKIGNVQKIISRCVPESKVPVSN